MSSNLIERKSDSDGSQKSKRIAKFAVGFFAVMVVLTFFSNTINNLSLPRVKTGQPQNGQIIKEFNAQGKIVPLGEKSLTSTFKGKVVKLDVKVGDAVKVDDVIMELEDKEAVDDAAYEEAKHQIALAKKEIEDLLEPKPTPTPDPYKLAIEQKRKDTAYQKLVKAYWEAVQALAENDDPDQAKTLSEAVVTAWEAMQTAQEDREIEAREELTKAREEAQKAQEEAKKLADDIAEKRYQLRVQEEKLAKMREERADSGIVKAQYKGVIRKLDVELDKTVAVGDVIAVVHDLDKGYEFRANITNEEAKRVKKGDAVEILLGSGLMLTGKVSEVKEPEGEATGKEMIVSIDNQEALKGGESASITIISRSRNYDFLVPVGAVYTDNEGKYILTMSEKPGPLGNQYTVSRVPVTVIDQDNFRAALSVLGGWTNNIVLSSDKPISDGARVMPAR